MRQLFMNESNIHYLRAANEVSKKTNADYAELMEHIKILRKQADADAMFPKYYFSDPKKLYLLALDHAEELAQCLYDRFVVGGSRAYDLTGLLKPSNIKL